MRNCIPHTFVFAFGLCALMLMNVERAEAGGTKTVTVGTPVTLNWSVGGSAAGCLASTDYPGVAQGATDGVAALWTGMDYFASGSQPLGAPTVVGGPYRFTCTAVDNTATVIPGVFDEAFLIVTPLLPGVAPTSLITVNPNPVPYGSDPDFILTSTNATECSVVVDGIYLSTNGPTAGTYKAGAFTTPGPHMAQSFCRNGITPQADWSYTPFTVLPQGACLATTINNCILPQTVVGGTAGSCSTSGSCNYTCTLGGVWGAPSTNSCTGGGGGSSCTGSVPTHAGACVSTNPSVDTPYTVIPNCSVAVHKCQYACDSGYVASGGVCILTQCNDGVDNDSDGKIDFVSVAPDPGCTSIDDNDETDALPIGPTLTASPRIVNQDDQTRLTYTTNGESCTLNGGTIHNQLVTSGNQSTPVGALTTFTLTCPSGTARVTVEIIPKGFET